MAFRPAGYDAIPEAKDVEPEPEPMTQAQQSYVRDLYKHIEQVAAGHYYQHEAQAPAQEYAKTLVHNVNTRLKELDLPHITALPIEKASETIKWLKAQKTKIRELQLEALEEARQRKKVDLPPVVEGTHDLKDGKVYRVQKNHYAGAPFKVMVLDPHSPARTAKGNRKFQRLTSPEVVALRTHNPQYLTEATLMSKQKAIEFGQLYEFCARCGRILEVQESIEQGIGPVCIDKFV